ncbi:hypothetical protein SAMN02910265_02989 [Ruminococcus flavefaciens]|uniref:Uncharacterized protein n=1 Tax=Ruminococcus flavefaciens TaxID=1265 RepID=A0A1H6LHQ4_RUMFL|nr:hypothetical protein SAMN02910265_02989 [Ruminococcus flavefaciens]
MYFGAVKADPPKYMLGSILGMLPNIIISTIMCDNLSKPASPAFFICSFIRFDLNYSNYMVYQIY